MHKRSLNSARDNHYNHRNIRQHTIGRSPPEIKHMEFF
jgi:hypothetical protein